MIETLTALSLSMMLADDPRPRSQQAPTYPNAMIHYDLEAECSAQYDIDGSGFTQNIDVRGCRVGRIPQGISQNMSDREIRDVERRAEREFAMASQDAIRRWRFDNPEASAVFNQRVEFQFTRYRVTMRTR